MAEWEIHGMEFGNCNCAYGCPCQFNAPPTHGDCHAITFFIIERGHFNSIRLDGLKMAFIASWPGPIHEGRGGMQPIIDARADEEQRWVLIRILTGQGRDAMKTFFGIFAAMCDTIHDPVYTEIRIDLNIDARTAACEAVGVATGRGEPIRNPVTGAEHRIGIILPEGFEFTRNECGRGWSSSSGALALELRDSYAQWCELHLTHNGPIR